MRAGVVIDGCEAEVLRLIAEGRVDAARGALHRRNRDDLFAALAAGDIRFHLGEIDVPELQLLEQRADAEDPGGHSTYWLKAIICERLLLHHDPLAIVLAEAARVEMGDDLLPLLGLYSRARINRIAASSWLVQPTTERRREARTRRDAAIRDLIRCGFTQEVTLTLGLAAAFDATTWGEDIGADLEELQAARRSLGAGSTVWSMAIDAFIAVVALQVDDPVQALEAVDRIDRSPIAHRNAKSYADVVRAFASVKASNGEVGAVAAFEQALDDIGDEPGTRGAFNLLAANLLLDLDSLAGGRFARACLDLPRVGTERDFDHTALELRLAIVAGKHPESDGTRRLVEAVAASGRSRHAAGLALRFANDLARQDDVGQAADLRRWAIERLPGPHRRTPWEHRMLLPSDTGTGWATNGGHLDRRGKGASSAPSSVSVPVSVAVLAPTLSLRIGTEDVTLNDSAAKLVLALAIAHPRPVHVEHVSELLWPGEPSALTRSRLSSLLHRMRVRLADAPGPLVRRDGAVLRLHVDASTDLASCDRLMNDADIDRRLDALLAIGGNLCDQQFPYDEIFLDARRSFAARWVRHAAVVLRARPDARDALAETARRLDFDLDLELDLELDGPTGAPTATRPSLIDVR